MKKNHLGRKAFMQLTDHLRSAAEKLTGLSLVEAATQATTVLGFRVTPANIHYLIDQGMITDFRPPERRVRNKRADILERIASLTTTVEELSARVDALMRRLEPPKITPLFDGLPPQWCDATIPEGNPHE